MRSTWFVSQNWVRAGGYGTGGRQQGGFGNLRLFHGR
ncbi:hypothetical protein BALAC2494_01992 [Bifidobacterium animalis subsp. lactis CNCM I-2494]|uniref:Uncharacterized protein n=1 Tax=Bifidobacterium animalis subsp. lactis CNCM I-2494 TaxID=1042403 RepID=A0A806FMP2_BIFAN|nr:hypothetical protein BALAC2494_01992 [Bifidobacterium animalis subsp. lactis CNCM I-2494]